MGDVGPACLGTNPQLGVLILLSQKVAEREGFEPPVPLGTTVFKTAAFVHSAISPLVKVGKLGNGKFGSKSKTLEVIPCNRGRRGHSLQS